MPIDPLVIKDIKSTHLDVKEEEGKVVFMFTATMGGSEQKLTFPVTLDMEEVERVYYWFGEYLSLERDETVGPRETRSFVNTLVHEAGTYAERGVNPIELAKQMILTGASLLKLQNVTKEQVLGAVGAIDTMWDKMTTREQFEETKKNRQ